MQCHEEDYSQLSLFDNAYYLLLYNIIDYYYYYYYVTFQSLNISMYVFLYVAVILDADVGSVGKYRFNQKTCDSDRK